MIEVHQLRKSFPNRRGGPVILDDITLTAAKGDLFTLLGPSGCGKTTLLRCIAGLEVPDAGTIRIDGSVVFSAEQRINVATNRRHIGMVFQSYAIWPHMTVYENVAFPLATGRAGHVASRVKQALHAVDLVEMSGRPATRLSGGQQQRVALARAIVAEPATLLLDEPLSNLDAGLREQMRDMIRRLQQQLGLTTVLVTHDQEEALSLSDRIALLQNGRVVEEGTPDTLYADPQTVFGAMFVGAANVIAAEAGAPEQGLTPLTCGFGRLWSTTVQLPGPAWAAIRPEKVKRATSSQTSSNSFKVRVKRRKFLGEHAALELEITGSQPPYIVRSRGFDASVGEEFAISVDPADVRLVREANG